MADTSFRRPRFSGRGPALFFGLLGGLLVLAIGFALWGVIIYPATPTATPMPIVGTLTAIAEAAASLPPVTSLPSLPTSTPPPETTAAASQPTATPSPAAGQPTATDVPATATPTAVIPANPTVTPAGVSLTATPPPPTATPLPPTLTPQPQNLNTFAYGLQAHMIGVGHDDTVKAVNALGFDWLKQQIEWKMFEKAKGQYDWAEIDRMVDTCDRNGIHLLVSVVKAPDWARGASLDASVEGPPQNLQDYADFVGAMAARYKGRIQAYEIWNEQNLHYEWGNEQIDAARYVQLLKLAYQAIKAADPQALVISGALTPAGSVPGPDGRWLAIEDATYLRQMYEAGLKNYCDGVGVHPSGYNIPPDVDWQTYQDPGATFRGLWDTPHYSWSFRGVLETYRQIMVQNGDAGKLLWVTEFGWAVSSEPPANRQYAADNTLEEQRDWTVKAFQMGKSWGWVGPMFLWNLNFRQIVPWSEQAMWSIIEQDGAPLPVYVALQNMAK
ncbi:MAG: endo-1,4-beta-xylanase [Chloroflexota bacterium]